MRRLLLVVISLLLSLTLAVAADAIPPGNLAQTNAEPSFGATLTNQMRLLARSITANSSSLAMNVFFPEAAYVQMKMGEISAPSSDYVDRLVAFYRLDVGAYHQKLIGDTGATFLRVNANAYLARWIPAGACENRIGYWHVPGVRLVWEKSHHVVSVAVASLISWRGTWYVVHLGPNPRPTNVGTVDDYENGPGVAGPGGGC